MLRRWNNWKIYALKMKKNSFNSLFQEIKEKNIQNMSEANQFSFILCRNCDNKVEERKQTNLKQKWRMAVFYKCLK